MYLAVTLLRAGLEIRCLDEGAPDIRVQLPDGRVLWLEATAPTGGEESRDRVAHPPRPGPAGPGVAYDVPTERMILRVSGALHTKAGKLRTYREQGVIAPEDQALVAISVRDIPHGISNFETIGLGAVYGVGPQYVTFDPATLDVVDSGAQRRPQILRSSGSLVDTEPFVHAGFEHVTGALISVADSANCPDPLGLDFRLFPNPNAVPAYTEGQLLVGHEWRLRPTDEKDVYQLLGVLEHSKPRSERGGAA
jgi:hypothetical protein